MLAASDGCVLSFDAPLCELSAELLLAPSVDEDTASDEASEGAGSCVEAEAAAEDESSEEALDVSVDASLVDALPAPEDESPEVEPDASDDESLVDALSAPEDESPKEALVLAEESSELADEAFEEALVEDELSSSSSFSILTRSGKV